MKRLAVLSFLALFGIGASVPVSCPSAEDLAPCTCKRMAYGLHVLCAHFEDNAGLEKAFQVIRNYQIQNVLLHGLNLTEVLPTDLFSGLEIAELRVEYSNLKFSQPAFTGLEDSLKVLTVSKSVIESPENSLAKLDKLVELNIREVSLGKITNQWLNGKIPNVRILTLDDNHITDVESKAFAELKYLVKFSAAGNGITTLARSMGHIPLLYLESMDYSRNKISDFPEDLFTDFPKLTTLKFSSNNLKTISEVIWSGIWEQLDTVMLFDNDIVCDENLDWLRKVKWPREVTANCVLPNELVGKTLREVYKPEE